ncbi:MAG: hypothetical protein JO242_01595 [Streptosporangiaceae bacterium]|nr:hypothetical protein [Streptosporangiaceae bacterium]
MTARAGTPSAPHPATWTRTDVTALTGATVSTSVSVGALYLGGSNPSTQVFALSPAGHLLSFTTTGDGGNWQVFDLSGFSGSTAVLTTAPHPIQFGSTVDVYATDNQKHLQDFYKPLTANWQDLDLTSQTRAHAIFGVPFAYGGNSIQTVSNSGTGDLEITVQGVFPNGLINPSVKTSTFDITQLSGHQWFPGGVSSPVVAGGSTVNIFVEAGNNFVPALHLIDFTKTPAGQWTANDIAPLSRSGVPLTPSAIWDPSVGLHAVINDDFGELTDYSTGSTSPPLSAAALPSAGTALGDPSLVRVASGPSGPTLLTFSNHS